MENTKSPPAHSQNNASVLGKFLFLSVMSWFLLLIWFSTKWILYKNASSLSIIHVILENQFKIISHHHPTVLNVIVSKFNMLSHNLHALLEKGVSHPITEKVTHLFIGTLEIITTRFVVFAMYLPLVVMILMIFIIDGLVQRDIRKFKVERESALFFHRLKPLSGVMMYLLYFIYLASPWNLTLATLLVPMTLVSGIFAMLSIKHFKKYL